LADVEDRAIRVNHAMLDREATPLSDLGQRLADLFHVVGVHPGEEGVGMRRDLPGPIAEDVELFVRPDRRIAAQVVLPAADTGDPLCFDEAAAALLQLGFRAFAHDHAGDDIGNRAQIGDFRLVALAPVGKHRR
jgi:hypothetical protein